MLKSRSVGSAGLRRWRCLLACLANCSFGTVLHDLVRHGEGRRCLSWGGDMKGGFFVISAEFFRIFESGALRIRLGFDRIRVS